MIIAVDGPAGSGKSTISKKIAQKFGLTYIDTGAMYRMITLKVLRNNINIENIEEVKSMLEITKLDINKSTFILDDKDVSEEIRSIEVSQNVSKIAAIKEVREKLVYMQRDIAKSNSSILDGRDIGTVVFPNAELKIFLTASPSERANRRMKEYIDKNIDVNYQEILNDIILRDKKDSERKESPLKKADDAIEVNTDNKTIKEVCDEIEEYIFSLEADILAEKIDSLLDNIEKDM